MVIRRLAALLAASFALPSGAANACAAFDGFDAPSGAVAKSGYEVRYRFDPTALQPLRQFAVEVAVCGPDGPFAGPLKADADMPVHRHGMNYRPAVLQTAPGRYRAEGFLLHMPGAWRFKFDLTTPDGPVRLRSAHDVS